MGLILLVVACFSMPEAAPLIHLVAASPAAIPDDAPEVEHLEKIREAARRVDSGLSLLNRAAWTGWVLTGRDELSKAADLVGRLEKPAGDLDEALRRLIDAIEPEVEDKEIQDALSAMVGIDRQAGEIRKLGTRVKALPVGLVSDAVDKRFRVTADLLARDPKEAERRFKSQLNAMEKNTHYLRRTAKQLEELALRADAAASVLRRLNEGIEKAVHGGLFTRVLVSKYLDIDDLERACRELGSDAGTKAKATGKAAAEQERRHDNMRNNLNTFLNIAL